MESLGEKLRAAREDKGCNYEQASRDTNIAARYLEALETENFDQFKPLGEPYILGFLRNYGEYLGLDTKELLDLHRALKIQEQPVPVEQLLRGPPRLAKIIRAAVVLAVVFGAAGAGVYFFSKISWRTAAPAAEQRPSAALMLDSPFLERRFYRGDAVIVPLGDKQYKLELADLGETVTISTPAESKTLDLGQEVLVDLDTDGIADLRITVEDFAKNDPAAGALLRFDLENSTGFDPDFNGDLAGGGEVSSGSSALAAAPVYFTSANPYPFTVQAVFQGYCMLRWQILGERDRTNRNEQYFQRGEELNIQAQNGIRLWLSNAAAVKLQLIGGGREVAMEIGSAGEVVVADVRWVKDDEGRFRLALIRID